MRYQFYYDGKGKTICVSHYAGKAYRGVSKCAPSDTYDKEMGAYIAKLRCDRKIAIAKMNAREEALDAAEAQYYALESKIEALQQLMYEACDEYEDIDAKLEETMEELK